MELDVIQELYNKRKIPDLVNAINTSVAKRIVQLTKAVDMQKDICITGGVSKNIGVVTRLEELLNVTFKPLPEDPQLMGAIGAAVFASYTN